jgi:hypothetical protein
MVDIHIQKGDYGWMFSRKNVKSKKEAVKLGTTRWDSAMKYSDNPTTRKAYVKLKKEPYRVTVMPMDAMRGTVMFEDFGKLAGKPELFKRTTRGKLEKVI